MRRFFLNLHLGFAKSSLLLASAAIDVVRKVTVPLRIMNPLEEPKTVFQDTVLGTGEVCF